MNEKLYSIQFLRGLAAVLVAAVHLADSVARRAEESGISFYSRDLFSFGGAGVDIFFAISGFIMVYIAHGGKPLGSSQFLLRRAVRIYPIYWVFSAALLLFLMLPITKADAPATLSILKAFALYPELNEEGNVRPVLLGQGWTLIFELYFYFVFALFIGFTERRRTMAVMAAIAICYGVANALPLGVASDVLGNAMVFEFCFGMMIGYCYVNHRDAVGKRWLWAMAGLFGLTLALLLARAEWWTDLDRAIHTGIPAALLVAICVFSKTISEIKFPKISNLLGDASYSLYLAHPLGILFFSILWKRDWILGPSLFGTLGLDVYFVTILILLCAIGIGSYYLLERPITQYLYGRLKRRALVTKPSFLVDPVNPHPSA